MQVGCVGVSPKHLQKRNTTSHVLVCLGTKQEVGGDEKGRKVVVGPEPAGSCLDSEACPVSLLVYYLSFPSLLPSCFQFPQGHSTTCESVALGKEN